MIWQVFLNGKEYTKQTIDLHLEKKRDHFYSASGRILNFDESEFNLITKAHEITIRSPNSAKNNFQGEFSNIDYDANMHILKFRAYNFPVKFNNYIWTDAAKEWTNVTFKEIIDYIFHADRKFVWDSLWYEISDSDLQNIIVNFRIENEPIWDAISRLLKQVGATWYARPYPFSDSLKKFTQEKLYFDYDFYTDQYDSTLLVKDISRVLTKEYENVINDITVLGRGDGINQLKSTNFHATLIRSKLNTKLENDDTTLILVDASDFPDDNSDIWIGTEKIGYSTKSNNTLTISERGKDGTISYEHRKGIEVYLATYGKNSPEEDSSIDKFNICSSVYTDRTIIDQNTLDLLAQRIIAEYAFIADLLDIKTKYLDDLNIKIDDEFVTGKYTNETTHFSSQFAALCNADADNDWIISLSEYNTAVAAYNAGHTYDKTEIELIAECYIDYSGNIKKMCVYQCTAFSYSDKEFAIRLQAGGVSDPLLGEIANISKRIDIENIYGAGATNLYQVQSYENCDADHPLHLRFFMPSDIVAINSVKLNFKIKPYRAYTGTTPDGGGGTTPDGGGGTTPDGGGVYQASAAAGGTAFKGSIAKHGYLSYVTTAPPSHTHKIYTRNGEPDYPIGWKGGADCGQLYADGCGSGWHIKTAVESDALKTAIYCNQWLTREWVDKEHTHIIDISDHRHSTPSHYHVVPIHNHLMQYKITEITQSLSIAIKAGNDGGTLTTVPDSPFISDQTNIDITNIVQNVGVGNWIDIRFTPNSITRIEANAYIQVYIRSRISS